MTRGEQKPNILLIMADQMTPFLTGTYGHPVVKTSNLDRLAEQGIRFDAAYHGLFKTNRRQIRDYRRLSAYMERILQIPGVRATVDMDHILHGYYSIKALNPQGIVPEIPDHIATLLRV